MNVRTAYPTYRFVAPLGAAVALLGAGLAAAFVAPTDSQMGESQRLLYVHVPVAWVGLLSVVGSGFSGAFYLWGRKLTWDDRSLAAAELAWLFSGLTLVSGACWARIAWGTWWTWEPRLTTSFILWLIATTYCIARYHIDDPHRRARIGAVLACLAGLNVPLVIAATRVFRGIHPVSPTMDPTMRAVLALCVASLTGLFFLLWSRRTSQWRRRRMSSDGREPGVAGCLSAAEFPG